MGRACLIRKHEINRTFHPNCVWGNQTAHVKNALIDLISFIHVYSMFPQASPSSPTRPSATMEDLFRNWCMSCFHASIVRYDPCRTRPMTIQCTIGDGETPCDQCFERIGICESARVHLITFTPKKFD
jgi:hypothetical protein